MDKEIKNKLELYYPDVQFNVVPQKDINLIDVFCFVQQYKCRVTLNLELYRQCKLSMESWLKAEIGKYINELFKAQEKFRKYR